METFVKHLFRWILIYLIVGNRIDFVYSNGESYDFVFVTSSNANNFMRLENLIGSIHTYASRHLILVYDFGLTSTQRIILKNYFNVQIYTNLIQSHMAMIQHASTLYNRIIYIDVNAELIDYPSIIEKQMKQRGYVFIAKYCRNDGSVCYSMNETRVVFDLIAFDQNSIDVKKLFATNETIFDRIRSADWIVHSKKFDIRCRNRDSISLPYVDLIRKFYRLVVVIPFIDQQIDQLFRQLNTNQLYSPCQTKSSSTIDLLFYYNRLIDRSLRKRIEKRIRSRKSIHQCFHHVSFISANLTDEENIYPRGINLMWQRLFVQTSEHNSHLLMQRRGYTHFFWMEPDTLPVREFWLDALINEIRGQSKDLSVVNNWWIRGSIYRGTFDIEDYLIHINGNALYHLSSIFVQYLKLVWDLFPFDHDQNMAFDSNTFFYMIGTSDELPRRRPWKGSKIERQNMTKRFWHKFIFSEFIQNCAYTNCMNHPIDDSPLTYFVHGSERKRSPDERRSFWIQWDILFLFIPLLIICFFTRLVSMRTIRCRISAILNNSYSRRFNSSRLSMKRTFQ